MNRSGASVSLYKTLALKSKKYVSSLCADSGIPIHNKRL